jgi:phospho-N-acetylmuramoyl-pentapeptide-transferase
MIRKLTAYKIGQAVRDDGPQTHLIKTGTPTMGGRAHPRFRRGHDAPLGGPQNRYVWICLLTTLGFGAIGWVDDWRKVVHRNPRGLRRRRRCCGSR